MGGAGGADVAMARRPATRWEQMWHRHPQGARAERDAGRAMTNDPTWMSLANEEEAR